MKVSPYISGAVRQFSYWFAREQMEQLRKAIDRCLSQCEKQVIVLRYGLDGQSAKRQREVAQVTGLSRSYISRIEKRALQKLKQELVE